MYTDRAWELRIRRKLEKYGLKLHKSRAANGGYTVFVMEGVSVDLDGTEKWFADLESLRDFMEYMMEKYDGR